jgi:NTE family protein
MKALVLSGGGSHGAFEVGVLKKLMLFDKNEYDIFTGISVGAINAAFLAQYASNPGETWNALKYQWDITTTSRVRKSWFLGPLAALWKQSVYNSAPLEEWLQRDLKEKLIKTSGKKLRVVAVSMNTGESVTITEQDKDLANWVAASAAFPVMFKPVEMNNESYLDGGIRSVTPLGEAILAGATEIDVIMCSNPDIIKSYDGKSAKTLGIAGRTITLLVNQIMRDDLKICDLKNKIPGYKPITVRVFKPNVDLDDVMDSLDFDQLGIQKMIKIGFDTAMKQIK